ncbi:MAG TPA: hypothetical protein VJS38_13950 [Phenylobacterium sp.]|uniref:hypothetical protein n=1 Tax=Phenylobacterium sp. TaxID=1871053 RepID=UPI002B48A4F5|nr:hypothetical protein [Phenylobacterium sp.]HKR89268.1 hypothetical protein [Phenylobacterium sp.]
MAPRLKVFVTSDGLTDFAVATSSKVKALAAWGVRQDLFKEGLARETDDPQLAAEAIARPGEVLRRPAGSRETLAELKSVKRPAKPAKTARPVTPAPPEPEKPKGPSRATLKRIAELEARLADLDADHARAVAGLAKERAALERRAEALETDHAARRQKLETALSAARQAPA